LKGFQPRDGDYFNITIIGKKISKNPAKNGSEASLFSYIIWDIGNGNTTAT
jgi:hypothetical protein